LEIALRQEIVKRIKTQMLKKGIKKYAIRKKTGMAGNQLDDLLNGKDTVQVKTLFKVLKIVGIKNIKISYYGS